MAEVGTYYITIMPDMSKFTGGVNAALGSAGTDGGNKYSASFMDVLKGSAIGTALGALAEKAGSALVSGLKTGIGRLNTIENFPKVMESLGYEAGQASDAINLIMDHLDGLPTATQDVVTLTQAIADSTGSLDLATRASLGFNDMMLANGASSAEVTQAQGVFNRVLGKGNATVAQWQSLQSVMPAQLAAVARELLGTGGSVEELRDKLNDGSISWDEFLQAIVKLDENGYMDATGKQIASFAEQARANSHGIGTAMENVQNRIGAGWASILGAIGREDIADTINNMSYGVRDGMDRIADAVSYLKDAIGKTDIAQHFSEVMQRVGDAINGIWSDGGPDMLKSVADGIINLVDGALDWLANNGDAVAVATNAVVGALLGIVGLKIGMGLASLPGIMTALNAALAANPFIAIAMAIAVVAMALYGFFTQTETGRQLWKSFCDTLSNLWKGFCDTFTSIVQAVIDAWNTFKQNLTEAVEKVVTYIKTKWDELVQSVAEFCVKVKETVSQKWQEITQAISTKLDEIKTFVTEKWEAVKTTVSTKLDEIKTYVTTKWEEAKTAVSTKLEEIKTFVTDKWEAIKSTVSDKLNSIRDAINKALDTIKSKVTSIITNVQTFVNGKLQAIKTLVSNIFEGIRSVVNSALDWIQSTTGVKVDGIKNKFNSGLTAAKTVVLNIFDGIKNGIHDKLEWAKQQVSNIIGAIKGLFNFSWSLPKPSIPHITWSWKDVGGIVKIPSFSVSWYAKGGIFDAATIIGIGERGKEAALPLNKSTYREMASGIVGEMAGGGGVRIDKLADTIVVREEADIDRICDEISRRTRRERTKA